MHAITKKVCTFTPKLTLNDFNNIPKVSKEMETKEYEFRGMTLNGIAMLLFNLVLQFGSVAGIIFTGIEGHYMLMSVCILLCIISFFVWAGFIQLEPNEARVMMFFGQYKGTFTRTGYFWVNPFIIVKKLSLRARNLDVAPIKVNDKEGNPIMIGVMLVWKVADTYKAMFDIDSQTMALTGVAENAQVAVGQSVANVMSAFENFVLVQSDAALRQVAGHYAYDDTDDSGDTITLRGGSVEINAQLETKLSERLSMAGIEIIEARINYLAYASEIAAVMLRRQQATAILAAREKIVEGAVSMVKMAVERLESDEVVKMDEAQKAAMVSNLLVVLCSEDKAQPVVSTGA